MPNKAGIRIQKEHSFYVQIALYNASKLSPSKVVRIQAELVVSLRPCEHCHQYFMTSKGIGRQ